MDVQSFHSPSSSEPEEMDPPCFPSHVRKPPVDASERLRALLAEAANEDPEDEIDDFAAFRQAINESRREGRKLYR